MSHEQVLLDRVRALRSRIRLLIAQQWLCVGLTYAALAGLLLVAATKLRWWTDAQDYLWALLVLGGITGLIIGFTRKITPMVAAQIADERAGLKERLSTAVELSGAESRSEVAEAQIADAAQHAADLRAAEVLPWKAPPQLRYLAAAIAILLAAIYVPELPIFHSRQERMDREVMQTQGKSIQRVAKLVEAKAKKKGEKDENAAILRRIAQNMKQLGKDSERGRISKKQAMLRMNELKKQLEDAEKQIPGANAEKSLDKVAADLKNASQRSQERGNAEAAKALKQMSDSLGKKDFEAAKRQLEELAKKMQSGQMTAEDAGKASEMMQQMAEAMQNSGLDKAGKELKDAAEQLKKAADAAKQLQQQMAQAKSDAERQQLQQQASQQMSQMMAQAGQSTQKAGGT